MRRIDGVVDLPTVELCDWLEDVAEQVNYQRRRGTWAPEAKEELKKAWLALLDATDWFEKVRSP